MSAEISGKPGREIADLNDLNDFLYELNKADHYIARSEYLKKLEQYDDTISFFKALIRGDMLREYCDKHNLSASGVEKLLARYENCIAYFDKHNTDYIKRKLVEEKDYLDQILQPIDPDILLDERQREVVLSDEDYTLVIAGAGAGKTTTVAAKARYLIEKQGIPAEEILIVSFTNKAVEELRSRINKALGLPCVISTFHSIGNAIIRTRNNEDRQIVTEGKLYYLLLDYFKKAVFTDEALTRKLVLFFATYFDIPYDVDDVSSFLNELSRNTYTTLRSDLSEFKQELIDARSHKKVTISNEIVRSYQEVQIANFLYLHDIDYRYEPLYPYKIQLANKPYTPDFMIRQGDKVAYIEHFGISEDGHNSMYSDAQLKRYKAAVNDKILLHRKHHTRLIYTFSQYKDGRSLLEHLQEQLQKNGFVLGEKDEREVLNKLIESEENKYVSKLIILICRFINLFKTNGYTQKEFDRFRRSTDNVRNQLFLDISEKCYLEYERYLKENRMIDFQDMINESSRVLKEMAEKEEKLRFRYVIVDEYQDISRQRFDLVEALHKVCEARIVAVGDDWQSIYAFSGSDVELFLEFEKKMGYAKMLKIENTYRNSQEVIDIAGNFIQKNEYQIAKSLKSPKHIENPIIIYTFDQSRKDRQADNKSGFVYNLALSVEKCLDDIVAYARKEGQLKQKILVLGRYNFDGNRLENSGLFEFQNRQGKLKSLKYPDLDLTFMTIHSSKGLGYDNVIIVNCQNARLGFPSQIQNDPVLKQVMIEDHSYDYAEERRLFYVAMTRTKNRVYCVAPERYPSRFLIEIYKDYQNIIRHGEWTEDGYGLNYERRCPICNYPLQYRYKPAYGLRLYICSNDPELCGFLSNDLKGGKMQISKCDKCEDGYLIIRSGRNGPFLSCTSYKPDGSGCNNTISKERYYRQRSLTPDEETVPKKPDRDLRIAPRDDVHYEKDSYDIAQADLHDFYLITLIILSCVSHISRKLYISIEKTIMVLLGKQPKTSPQLDFKSVPEFGKLRKCRQADLEKLISLLIDEKLLLKTKAKNPVLHPTAEGIRYQQEYDEKMLKKLHRAYRQ